MLRRAYRTLYRSELTLQQARERLAAELAELVAQASADAPMKPLPQTALAAPDALRLFTGFLARVERGIVR